MNEGGELGSQRGASAQQEAPSQGRFPGGRPWLATVLAGMLRYLGRRDLPLWLRWPGPKGLGPDPGTRARDSALSVGISGGSWAAGAGHLRLVLRAPAGPPEGLPSPASLIAARSGARLSVSRLAAALPLLLLLPAAADKAPIVWVTTPIAADATSQNALCLSLRCPE